MRGLERVRLQGLLLQVRLLATLLQVRKHLTCCHSRETCILTKTLNTMSHHECWLPHRCSLATDTIRSFWRNLYEGTESWHPKHVCSSSFKSKSTPRDYR